MSKLAKLVRNDAGGIDLLTERDSGNQIRILTGKPTYSEQYWQRLKKLADIALLQLELWENGCDVELLSLQEEVK